MLQLEPRLFQTVHGSPSNEHLNLVLQSSQEGAIGRKVGD